MKKMTLLTLLFFIANLTFGQVVINEYSASNLHSFKDNYGKTEDWIELYNTSDVDVNIGGWHLSDKKKKPGKWKIPSGTIIPAKGFLVFWCSGRDESKDGHFHTSFKLSQTKGKDKVILSDASENILEKHDMIITLVEHSICRETDGGDNWVICSAPTLKESNNGSTQFKRYSEKPEMSLTAGFYSGSQTVSITNNEPNSVLRFTIDGKNPTNISEVYSAPVVVNKTTVIKARSFPNDSTIFPGKMDFNTYFIDENDFTLPVFSVASDDIEELANGNKELEPIGSLEYFNTDKEREAISYGEMNKHGQDSWILNHRSIDWVSRDEMGYNKEIKAPLFTYSKRDGFQRVMFRNSGDDNYPANDDADHVGSTHIRDEYVQTLSLEGGMHLDTRAVRRVILFLNGKYWGLYGMREKPVDHDFTDEYYGQDKYHLHYLTTWGTTKAKYGGQEAFDDWYKLRDFILDTLTDMSLQKNYNKVKAELDMLSFIDFFIANQNTVAKDWLNYNTAWWRGLDSKGTHKKWGYLLWDLDATFNYYINYTGIPNENYNAQPCDINAISKAMDEFFSDFEGGGVDTLVPADCITIKNGSCPYPADDSIFIQVINQDEYCCNLDWNETCQVLYDNIKNSTNSDTCATIINGSCPYTMDDPIFQQVINYIPSCCSDEWGSDCQEIYNFIEGNGTGEGEVKGNVGMHEKIFIKLLEQNREFKQLYFSRYADLMNTVYSCENMNATLDRMLAVIEPEMPRQIERWGGTIDGWKKNVKKLKDFVNNRCEYLGEGLNSCYEVTGPFEIAIMIEPENVGSIDFNTIELTSFPWHGSYYGEMENRINAKVNDGYKNKYKFSHWESKSGNSIMPNELSANAKLKLVKADTLIAIFESANSTNSKSLPFTSFKVFPNPTKSNLNITYSLKSSSKVRIDLYSVLGEKIATIDKDINKKAEGKHSISYDLHKNRIKSGVYLLKMKVNDKTFTKKLMVLD